MFEVVCEVEIDAKNKKDLKHQAAELDNIIQSIPSLFENQSTNNSENFNKAFQTINNSLGEGKNEVKGQKVRKAMIEHDPELYFDTFKKWVEEEEKKLEEERKKLEEADTISEIEYNEEEEKFLKGEITNQQKKEEIARQIEVKINVKKKVWSLWKWLKEQAKWLKTKAQLLRKNNKVSFEQKKEQIKQEIKNMENSSNLHTQQAFRYTKNQAEALLKELETIASENTNNTKAKAGNNFPTGWVVGIGAVLLTATLITALIIRRRKKITKIK